jgi:hypothetical protein
MLVSLLGIYFHALDYNLILSYYLLFQLVDSELKSFDGFMLLGGILMPSSMSELFSFFGGTGI